ncbi:hypothetical protein EV363DRAFT_1461054 [Boletus edulis]|nr:hypothetical protein EV363DRAFT_1461054 [Boletus edulis]
MTAKWVGDCFICTTTGNQINYFVGNESGTAIGPPRQHAAERGTWKRDDVDMSILRMAI